MLQATKTQPLNWDRFKEQRTPEQLISALFGFCERREGVQIERLDACIRVHWFNLLSRAFTTEEEVKDHIVKVFQAMSD